MSAAGSRVQQDLEGDLALVLLEGGSLSPRALARRLIEGPLAPYLAEPGLPAVATESMRAAAIDFALSVTLTGDYRWSDYMGDLWALMASVAVQEKTDG